MPKQTLSITINNGQVSGQLLSGWPRNMEADAIVEQLIGDMGFVNKKGHVPHKNTKVSNQQYVVH